MSIRKAVAPYVIYLAYCMLTPMIPLPRRLNPRSQRDNALRIWSCPQAESDARSELCPIRSHFTDVNRHDSTVQIMEFLTPGSFTSMEGPVYASLAMLLLLARPEDAIPLRYKAVMVRTRLNRGAAVGIRTKYCRVS